MAERVTSGYSGTAPCVLRAEMMSFGAHVNVEVEVWIKSCLLSKDSYVTLEISPSLSRMSGLDPLGN